MGLGGGGGAGALRREEEARQLRIKEGMGNIDTTFSGYNAPFFEKRAKAYRDYAMPTVADEYQNTANSLSSSLANRGLRKSGVANRFYSALSRESAKQQRAVVDAGEAEAYKLRQDVENTRGNLVNQLYSSADPALAKTSAMEAASRFAAPSTFAPVGGFFNDWSRVWLAGRLNNAYSAPGGTGGGTSTGNQIGYSAPGGVPKSSAWTVTR